MPPPFNDRHATHDRRDHQQRVNEQIRISPIRLIGVNGEQLGVVPTSQALDMAREANLDLVEVAAQERPPVCKIMDFGKFRYQQSHKQKKTKTHQQKLKEIRLRPKTGDHDVETKINQARKFLEHKDKVLVYVLYKAGVIFNSLSAEQQAGLTKALEQKIVKRLEILLPTLAEK